MFSLISIISLSLIGLGISFYLGSKKRTGNKLVCPIGGDCSEVINTKFGQLFGFDNTYLGILYYIAIIIGVASLYMMRGEPPLQFLQILIAVSGLAALMSIVLIGVQAFVLKKFCSWCMVANLSNIIIFILLATCFFSLNATTMKLTTPAFNQGELFPNEYTCDGANTNPQLDFSDIPEGTVSLALTMHDPDVPKDLRPDGNFDHWTVWNMPPDTSQIPANTKPNGIEGLNTRGTKEYRGPCPPDKEHRYFFYLYALDTMLELDPDSTDRAALEAAIEGHIIEKTELMGRYDRPR